MKRIVVKSQVSEDGTLHLEVPVGLEAANREVQVTVEVLPPPMTQEEWREFILSTAGKWEGEFERPEQSEFEERKPPS